MILRRTTIQALSSIPRVQHSNRPAFEKNTRATHPHFNISQRDKDELKTASYRSEYLPAGHIYPLAGDERTIGFDHASDTIRFDALEKARDKGKLRATASTTLAQETKQQKASLYFYFCIQVIQQSKKIAKKI